MNEKNEKTAYRIYKVIIAVILTAFITFMITSLSLYTYFTKNSPYALITGENSVSVENSNIDRYLARIKSVIEKNYLWKDKIDEKKLKDGAVEGYVRALGDKYTEYIPKSEIKSFTENITGSFVGIGVYMIADEDTKKIIVYYPIPESPAEKAGIKSGDAIIRVDGKEYGFDDFDIIADNIKGKEGTNVKIVIERDGEELEFEITRQKIETNPITSKIIKENIGYIKLPSFDTDSSKKIKEKIDDLTSKGAKSLILDLRNNGGGIVEESTDIADLFLDKGKIIMTTKDNKGEEEITKSKTKKQYDIPLIILTNENTASASEILTAALKDNERAISIGTKTYGKGVIQTVLTLSDGSGLKITTAEYFTPNGTELNKKGIKPNLEVKLPDTVKSIYAVKEDDDTQLNKAIEELSEKTIVEIQ